MIDDSLPVGAIQIGRLNHVMLSVHPVDAFASVVDCQSIGPEQMLVSDDLAVFAVHGATFYLGLCAPISPVDRAEIVDQLHIMRRFLLPKI